MKLYTDKSWITDELDDLSYLRIFDPKIFDYVNNEKDADTILQTSFNYPPNTNKRKILLVMEPPHLSKNTQYEKYDLIISTHREITSKNVLYYPLFFYYLNTHKYLHYILNRPLYMKSHNLNDKKFCLFINSNVHAKERINFCQDLMKYKKVDCAGGVLTNCERIKFDYWTPEFIDNIRNYKFMICFENSDIKGYITEKLANAYLGNTIPIYWGNSEPMEYINKNSIIWLENYNSENVTRCINEIIELDKNDELYMKKLQEPLFIDNKIPSQFELSQIRKEIITKLTTPKIEHIYIIVSREFEKDRFEYLTKYFESNPSPIPISFIEPLYKNRDEDKLNYDKYKNLKISEICLSQTYNNILNYVLTTGQETILTMESDVIFQDKFYENLHKIIYETSQLNDDCFCIFLGNGCNLKPSSSQKITEHLYKTNFTKCTDSIIFSRKAIKEIIKYTNEQKMIIEPIDLFWNRIYKETPINSYWIEPPIIHQGSQNGTYNSMIQ